MVSGSNPTWVDLILPWKVFFQGKIKSTQVGFEPETIKLESGGQGNFLKFFQKFFYSKQGGYLREKNIFDTQKNIFGRFWKKKNFFVQKKWTFSSVLVMDIIKQYNMV